MTFLAFMSQIDHEFTVALAGCFAVPCVLSIGGLNIRKTNVRPIIGKGEVEKSRYFAEAIVRRKVDIFSRESSPRV